MALRFDRRIDLIRACARVADRSGDAVFHNGGDELRGLGPMRRKRNQADVAVRGFLPAVVLTQIRRTYPLSGMCAPRTIVGTDEGPLYVKTRYRVGAGQFDLRAPHVPKTRDHIAGRPCNHGGKTARRPRDQDCVESPRNVDQRCARIIEIDSGKTVYLNVDKSWCKPDYVFGGDLRSRRRFDRLDFPDNLIERDIDESARCGIES